MLAHSVTCTLPDEAVDNGPSVADLPEASHVDEAGTGGGSGGSTGGSGSNSPTSRR